MGGCRCTYRNCTVKTDGKTHMFHYPVFEKVRCHQWLVNAQKLEFLNLKVSQLKNRVVCQHHFKEDNFMNYMNDKLTFDAIPTEDGPYCDPTKLNNNNLEEKQYSNLILLEDIESDYLFGNKKANFSLKYGDFLTNGELMDSSARYNSNNVENVNSTNYNNCFLKMTPIKPQSARLGLVPQDCVSKDQINIIQKPSEKLKLHENISKNVENVNSANYNNCFLKMTPIKPQSARLGLVPQDCVSKDQINIIQKPSEKLKLHENISKTLNKIDINKVIKPHPLYQEQTPSKSELNIPQISQSEQKNRVKKEPKVKILSETKINWPLPITGKFEKISPGTTLLIPEKKHEPKPEISSSTSKSLNTKEIDNFEVLEVLDVEFVPKLETVEAIDKNIIIPSPKTPTTPSQPVRILLNKSKLTPERTAAIEKKRKFNMKLKNVIESCLNNNDPIKIDVKPYNKNTQKSILKDANVQASSNPVKDESMKNFQEHTIAFLETRMNKMEETLLSRIDRNSQNIMNLNYSFHNIKSKNKKLVNAQTNTSEECYKKFLYREISPYLSENAKNLIYEELFINKYMVTSTPNSYNRKRRKVCV